MNPPWLPASECAISPSSRVSRRQIACSSAVITRSVRIVVSRCQPTIILEYTSITNATYATPAHVEQYV
jgi:hypothetical protein